MFVNLLINKLSQSNVRNACSFITEKMNMWIQDCGVDGSIILTQHWNQIELRRFMSQKSLELILLTVLEIKFMEIHAFDQVSHRFWLESSQMWITNFSENDYEVK